MIFRQTIFCDFMQTVICDFLQTIICEFMQTIICDFSQTIILTFCKQLSGQSLQTKQVAYTIKPNRKKQPKQNLTSM